MRGAGRGVSEHLLGGPWEDARGLRRSASAARGLLHSPGGLSTKNALIEVHALMGRGTVAVRRVAAAELWATIAKGRRIRTTQ